MKKIYIKPNIESFQMDLSQIIASSGGDASISINSDFELKDEGSMWSNQESSHNSIWD